MTVEFSIRQMVPSDAGRLREIAGLSFSRFMGYFAVRSLLSNEGQALGAESVRIAVGFAKLIEFQVGGKGFGCILWIAVHPGFRRRVLQVHSRMMESNVSKRMAQKKYFPPTQKRNAAPARLG